MHYGNVVFGSLGVAALLSFVAAYFIFVIAIYIYFAVVLSRLAKKLNRPEPSWWAWVPVVNAVLMLRMGGFSGWWLLIALVPWFGALALAVITVIVWMRICEKFGKPQWLGLLMIVPIANLILPGYLAFSNSSSKI